MLTVKAVDRPLTDQLRALRQDFAKVRRTKLWKQHITGGAYTLEITLNEDTRLWHPHLHILADATYFPQKLLRRLWHDATGSAQIVWVERIRDFEGAARELTKYIGEPQHVDTLTAAEIREYAFSVNGARMVQTFGDCFGLRVQDRDEPATESPDVYQVKLSRLVHLTFRGAETPAKLLVLIAERWPQFRSYIYHQLPQLELPVTKADRLKKLLKMSKVPGVIIVPIASEAAMHKKQDHEIFMAFTRYRADERADVFTDIDMNFGDLPQW